MLSTTQWVGITARRLNHASPRQQERSLVVAEPH